MNNFESQENGEMGAVAVAAAAKINAFVQDSENPPTSDNDEVVHQEPQVEVPIPVDAPNLDEKSEPGDSALSASENSGGGGESQANDESASSKVCKLNTPKPIEEIDLKCLLLADTTLEFAPVHLQKLLQHFHDVNLSPPELLLQLVYCIGLECGFISQVEYGMCSDSIERLAPFSSFHSKNVLNVSCLPPTYKTGNNKSHLTMQLHNLIHAAPEPNPAFLNALLTCLVTGDFLIVTFSPARSRTIPGRSICLSIPRYVLGTESNGKPLHQRFRKLDELSKVVRGNVFVPVRNRQIEALGINNYPSLVGLPAELYDGIFKYLNRNDMKIVANVCKQLNHLSTNSKHF